METTLGLPSTSTSISFSDIPPDIILYIYIKAIRCYDQHKPMIFLIVQLMKLSKMSRNLIFSDKSQPFWSEALISLYKKIPGTIINFEKTKTKTSEGFYCQFTQKFVPTMAHLTWNFIQHVPAFKSNWVCSTQYVRHLGRWSDMLFLSDLSGLGFYVTDPLKLIGKCPVGGLKALYCNNDIIVLHCVEIITNREYLGVLHRDLSKEQPSNMSNVLYLDSIKKKLPLDTFNKRILISEDKILIIYGSRNNSIKTKIYDKNLQLIKKIILSVSPELYESSSWDITKSYILIDLSNVCLLQKTTKNKLSIIRKSDWKRQDITNFIEVEFKNHIEGNRYIRYLCNSDNDIILFKTFGDGVLNKDKPVMCKDDYGLKLWAYDLHKNRLLWSENFNSPFTFYNLGVVKGKHYFLLQINLYTYTDSNSETCSFKSVVYVVESLTGIKVLELTDTLFKDNISINNFTMIGSNIYYIADNTNLGVPTPAG